MTAGDRQRLDANTLAHARAATVPEYDRSATPSITHLGFGGFARAHLAVYADELLRRGLPALIRGVSIRSHRAEDQLEPQDGLFTVATREPGEEMSLQVVGALASMETGPAAALDALTAPDIKLVTLTITEKGYEEGTDLPTSAEGPMSAPALIALSLAQRRRERLAPPVFASLDNLLDNGNVLRERVLEAAVDRRQRALPQFGGRPDGARSDRTRPGRHRRQIGIDRPRCCRRRALPLLGHAVGGGFGSPG
jgi:fructuronate reductase